MQQEDDLRGLARVMDFMRAVSILFVGINVYWFCYSTLKEWGVTFEVIDKILWNFQRTTGLFSSILWTKLFSVVFLALSCIGTKGVKEEKITWAKIHCSLAAGVVLFFLNWWLLELPLPYGGHCVLYRHAVGGLYLYAHGGYVDVPVIEKQPHG
ncbi:YWFCY domain-containing protein [Parabacteroides gordonii]|uniref:YWFCY domain-containing protein n=1 Tax=Parabacteroides gordonii TaxID=574930 RepID=UPI0021D4822D|nr:YWFCY domain-containing protein [Parabacteroides gordonii]